MEVPALLPEQLQDGPTLDLGRQLPTVTQGLLQWHLLLPALLHYGHRGVTGLGIMGQVLSGP